MSQAAGCNEPSTGEMLWQVLMDPGVSLKGGSCGGEQGVLYFLLLWPFWNILSSLAGMVSVDKKNDNSEFRGDISEIFEELHLLLCEMFEI